MKRFILAMWMAAVAAGIHAANTITLTGASGHPGDEVTLSLAMTGDDAVTALEAVIPLDEALTYVDGSCTLDATRAPSHQVTAAVVGGELRIYCYSIALDAFAGTAGEVLSFRLRLGAVSGDYTLEPQIVLAAADGSGAAPSRPVTATVTVLSPELTLGATSIDFGHVPIRSSYTRTLTLRNSGNEPLTVSSIACGDSALSVSPAEAVIAVGGSQAVTVTYSPTLRGAFASTLTVCSDAVNGGAQSVNVVADPYSVNTLAMGSSSGSSGTVATVGVSMGNMEPIVAAQWTVDLPSALKYVEGSAALTDRAVNHQIAATTDGRRLTIIIYSPDNTPLTGTAGDIATFGVSLEGTSGTYTLRPESVVLANITEENMVSGTSNGSVRIESPTIAGAATLDFGKQPLTEPLTAEYTVRNTGKIDLTVDRVTFLAEGYAVTTPLPLTIAAGASGTLVVTYTTAEAGAFATTMQIYSNDPGTPMKAVAVSGTAFSPNELTLSGTYAPGDAHDYRLGVSMDNDAAIVAVQFDITVVDADAVGAPTLERTSRLTDHAASVTAMGDGRWRVLVYSLANSAIEGTEGELLALTFPAREQGGALAPRLTFAIADVVLSTREGANIESPVTTKARTFTYILPATIAVEPAEVRIREGETVTITATVGPDDATDTTVTWTSADTSVATVDGSGAAPSRPARSGAAPSRPERSGAAPSRPERSGAAPSRPARSGAAPSRPERSGAAPSRPATGVITAIGCGETTLTATTWNGLTATVAVTILPEPKWAQTITWDQDLGKPTEGDVIELTATASSGLPVEYIVTAGASTITDGKLTVAYGPGTVEARQEGDDYYDAAVPVAKSFNGVTGVSLVDADGTAVRIEGNDLIITGTAPWSLYTIDGKLVAAGRAGAAPLRLPSAVYLLHLGGATLKLQITNY